MRTEIASGQRVSAQHRSIVSLITDKRFFNGTVRTLKPSRALSNAAVERDVADMCQEATTREFGTVDSPTALCEKLILYMEQERSTVGFWCLMLALGAGMFILPEAAFAAASHNPDNMVGEVAENADFWSNVLRYVSYFFSVLLGTAYVALKPIVQLLKKPTTAVLVIVGAIGLYFFVSTTVSAMLGVTEYDYDPSSIVTPIQ